MLTEKDYCDKDTAFALQELGYNPYMLYGDGTPAIHLWYAQKFLREEFGMLVDSMVFADNSIDADGKVVDRWIYYSCAILNTSTAEFIRGYDHSDECDTYEEALSEGIKESVKILKEKNINQRKALEAENTEFDYGHNVNYNERDTY